MTALVEREALGDLPSRIQGWIGKARARGRDRIELDFSTVELLLRVALRQPGAEYRRGEPSGETLEHYGERIAAKVRRVMMDRLDDDVIGCLGQSHIVFGKACAMEAVTTAMNEVRALSDSIPDTKGGRDG